MGQVKDAFRFLNRIFDQIENGLAYLAGLLLLFMAASICYEIVMRYFFLKPTLWVMGVVEYILICVTFLGTAWLLRHDNHVKVDIGLDAFSERGKAILNIVTSLIGLVSCAVMGWYGVRTTLNLLSRNVMTAQDPEIPKFTLMLFVPLGFLLLATEFLRMVFKSIAALKSLEVEEHRQAEGGE